MHHIDTSLLLTLLNGSTPYVQYLLGIAVFSEFTHYITHLFFIYLHSCATHACLKICDTTAKSLCALHFAYHLAEYVKQLFFFFLHWTE